MKVNVLGVQMIDYTSRRSGQPVKGVSLHVSFPDQQVKGLAVDSFFISDNLGNEYAPSAKVGDVVEIEFNRRGYVCNAYPVK